MKSLNKTLVVIPCSKKKIWDIMPSLHKVPAKDAYTSPYFKLCRKYAEKYSNKWVIFSGKYGILDPSTPIENYDFKLTVSRVRESFYNMIRRQFEPLSSGYNIIISLCGKDYSQVIQMALNGYKVKIYTPLRGKKIGERMKILKKSIDDGKPLL